MPRTITADVVSIDQLSADEQALWRQFRADNPSLSHPFFDLRYAMAASVAPRSGVAVLHEAGRVQGFFPLQRRGRAAQPLGAPLADYHGVIASSGADLHPDDIASALGLGLRVGAWTASCAPGPHWVARRRRICDVSQGRDALVRALETRDRKYCKNLRRLRRAAERELGPLHFNADERDGAVLEWIVAAKRAQYRRTRRHDVFACGWTQSILGRLFRQRQETGFGVRLATLRTSEGTLLAAEASLDDGSVQHLWFPAYATAYARFGAGSILTRLQLEAAAEAGCAWVDFGASDEAYKASMTEEADRVYEGLASPAAGPSVAQVFTRTLPASVRTLGARMRRRLDVIAACETEPVGWIVGVACAAACLAPRRG